MSTQYMQCRASPDEKLILDTIALCVACKAARIIT